MDKQNIKLSEGFAKGLDSIYRICKNHKSDGTQFEMTTKSGKCVRVEIMFNEVDQNETN